MQDSQEQYDYVLVDSMYVAHASWYKVKDLCTSNGTHTGLEFGFLKSVLYVVREFIPSEVILAWDGIPVERKALFPEYKAGRDSSQRNHEAPWGPRLEKLREAISPLTRNLYHPEKEADDIIAAFVKQAEAKGKKTLMYTSDQDMDQLITQK